MRRYSLLSIIVLSLFSFTLHGCCTLSNVAVSDEELDQIGQKIFMNECAGKVEYLTTWNEGEEFASLGIGHFIWYPKGKHGPFRETFPELLRFLKERGAELPPWLNESSNPSCPWNSRDEFIQDLQCEKMTVLRKFLSDTVSLQVVFVANRVLRALPVMMQAAPEESFRNVQKQFYRVALSPIGMYVLIDYANFKGEGVLKTERYGGQGWGLLQVLEEMKGTGSGPEALQEFCKAARAVLTRRVANAPKERNEQKWLPGWEKRINTYCSSEDHITSEDRTSDGIISKDRTSDGIISEDITD
jgi:hypothetical protein